MKNKYSAPVISYEELTVKDVLLSSIPSEYSAQYFNNNPIQNANPNSVYDD